MEEKIQKHRDIEIEFVSACDNLYDSSLDIIKTILETKENKELKFNSKYDIVVVAQHCKCVRRCLIDRITINQYDEISLFVYEEDDIDIEEIEFRNLFYEEMLELTCFIINENFIENEK